MQGMSSVANKTMHCFKKNIYKNINIKMSQRRKKSGLVQTTTTKKTTIAKAKRNGTKNKSRSLDKLFSKMRVYKAPVAVERVIRKANPIITSEKDGIVRLKHREYVSLIRANAGTNAYGVTDYAINIGNPTLFPWGSQLANLFESYKIHTLKFIAVTRLPTSQTGQVMMMADGDIRDTAPTSVGIFMQNQKAVVAPAWMGTNGSMVLTVQPEILNRLPKYLVSNSNGDTDLNSVVGSLNVATTVGSSLDVGDLLVEYDVTLFNPQPLNVEEIHISNANGTSFAAHGQFNASGEPFSTTASITVADDSIPVTFRPLELSVGSPGYRYNTFQLKNPGVYLIRWWVYSNSGTQYVAGMPTGAIGSGALPGTATNGFCVPMTYASTAPWTLTSRDAEGVAYTDCFYTDNYTDTVVDPYVKYPTSEVRVFPLSGYATTSNPSMVANVTSSYYCSVVVRCRGNGVFNIPFNNLISYAGTLTGFSWRLQILNTSISADSVSLPVGASAVSPFV